MVQSAASNLAIFGPNTSASNGKIDSDSMRKLAYPFSEMDLAAYLNPPQRAVPRLSIYQLTLQLVGGICALIVRIGQGSVFQSSSSSSSTAQSQSQSPSRSELQRRARLQLSLVELIGALLVDKIRSQIELDRLRSSDTNSGPTIILNSPIDLSSSNPSLLDPGHGHGHGQQGHESGTSTPKASRQKNSHPATGYKKPSDNRSRNQNGNGTAKRNGNGNGRGSKSGSSEDEMTRLERRRGGSPAPTLPARPKIPSREGVIQDSQPIGEASPSAGVGTGAGHGYGMSRPGAASRSGSKGSYSYSFVTAREGDDIWDTLSDGVGSEAEAEAGDGVDMDNGRASRRSSLANSRPRSNSGNVRRPNASIESGSSKSGLRLEDVIDDVEEVGKELVHHAMNMTMAVPMKSEQTQGWWLYVTVVGVVFLAMGLGMISQG